MVIDWSSLTLEEWWPLGLALLTLFYFIWQWRRSRGEIFPDIYLVISTSTRRSLVDHLAVITGAAVIVLLLAALATPSIQVSREVERTAREFMILLDSSGSMQADTRVARAGARLNYDRPLKLGMIPVTGQRGERDAGVDPDSVPYVARYEVARESIRRFLESRSLGDRVGLIYFNNIPFIVSIVTQNVAAIKEELKWLDDYVALGTLLHRGLDMAANILESSPSGLKQAVILISDAEISNFQQIKQELERLDHMNVSLHLLWLGEQEGLDAESEDFLSQVESMGGNIVALSDLTTETLDAAFANINRLESYSYVETRRDPVNLSEMLLGAARWAVLLWIFLFLTIYHPRRRMLNHEG